MKKGILARALRSVSYYLSNQDKQKSIGMFALLVVSSLLDVMGLAALVPVIMAASRPGSIFENRATTALYQFLSFKSEQGFLIFLIIALLIFFLFKNVFITIVNHQQNKFTAKIAVKIVGSQFVKFNNIPYWDFVKAGSSQLIHSTVIMPHNYVFGIIRQLFIFFSELVVVGIIIAGILFYQPTLFFILAIVLVPSTLLTYRFLRNRSQYIGNQIDILRPKSFTMLHNAFSGYIELKLAAKQPQVEAQLEENQRQGQALEATSYLYTQLPVRIIEMVAIIAIVTIFLYSLVILHSTTNLITIVGLFAAAAYRLMPSMNRLVNAMVTMRQTTFAVEALEEYRSYEQRAYQSTAQVPLVFKNNLVFDHVSFTFPGSTNPVINDISLTVKKGEKIGLIGTSGSGKTTLMNMLLRFYKEQSGHLLVDGVPLTAANLAAWYRLIGYVKQETFLTEESIRDNVTLNDEQVDEQRLHFALEQASLLDFINSLPDGVDTKVGERGSRLSGGQRQRIGIARALYKKTELLLLDEATSALDNETEREVSEAISKLSGTDMTMIIVAHRLTTLRECDRIIELKDGRVVGEFKYPELEKRLISPGAAALVEVVIE